MWMRKMKKLMIIRRLKSCTNGETFWLVTASSWSIMFFPQSKNYLILLDPVNFLNYIFFVRTAAHVLKHYVTFYNDYGDIIKATLGKARDNNKINCAKTMIQSLIYKFQDLQDVRGRTDRSSEEFHAIKELAKR